MILLGAIADDHTGATDLANTLVQNGMRVAQVVDVPSSELDVPDVDAVVIALKSRTIPAADAITQSLAALNWLQQAGATQIIFKYCSTFDSTPDGNIGPVADALMDAMGEDLTIACPAFPTNGRTIYQGHLFVGDLLLSDSGMKDHPLTPMRDANLVRVLQAQTDRPVALVPLATVRQGEEAVSDAFAEARAAGTRHLVVDAVTDNDLKIIGRAAKGLGLLTGGSGIAIGLPGNFSSLDNQQSVEMPAIGGRSVVMSGSCSIATREQVEIAKANWPCFEIDPMKLAAGEDVAGAAVTWFMAQDAATPALIYSSADPAVVAKIQEKLGRDRSGTLVEEAMGQIARHLRDAGIHRFVVAGGETSGAVVQALDVEIMRIGPEIDPGVPWTESLSMPSLALALKSGNFGGPDFFRKALDMLP